MEPCDWINGNVRRPKLPTNKILNFLFFLFIKVCSFDNQILFFAKFKRSFEDTKLCYILNS